MKTYIYSFTIAIALLLGASSCNELNLEKPGGVGPDNFYFSEKEAYNGTVAAYSDLKDYRYTWTLWSLGDVLSDDATYSGSDDDVGAFSRMESFDFPATNGRILHRWQFCYRAINKANQAIEGIERMSDDLFPDKSLKSKNYKERLLGEMYFLRGYFHHELVKSFGDVPIMLDAPTISSPRDRLKDPKEKVYLQIEADLLYAASVLPTKSEIGGDYTSAQAGRITQGAAWAMLSRVYLYQKKWSDVITASKKVFADSYSLVSNYGDQFTLAGEHGSESIFEINHYNSPTESAATLNNGNFHVLMMLPFGVTYGYGINQPRPSLAEAYMEVNDKIRMKATLLTRGDIQALEGLTDKEMEDLFTRDRTGYHSRKYYLPPGERSKEIRNNPVNIRLIRLAEVYLNYAEACVKDGKEGEAKIYLGYLRDRVQLSHISSSGDQLYDDIIKERRLELAMEGFRFWDVIRTGKAKELFKSKGDFTVGVNEILPIPQGEIDNTNSIITQNFGY